MSLLDYPKLDFSKLLLNVHDIDEGVDLMDVFPKLNLYADFVGYKKKDRNKIIRYVMYAFDVNSPLMELSILKDRTDHALNLAGIDTKKRREEIHGRTDSFVNALIRTFIAKIQANRKFELYMSMEAALQDLLENISAPIHSDDKTNPAKFQTANKTRFENSMNAEQLIKSLDKLEEEIFPHFHEVKYLLGSDKEASVFSAGAAEGLANKAAKVNG